MSVLSIGRSHRREPRKIVSADEAAEVTEKLVRLAYADTGSIAKSAANDAGSNERSARNWMEQKCAFSFATFLTLCRNNPRFKAVARKLLEMEAALDPETEKALVELQRALAATLERGGR